jgi:hypothetical protein
MNGQTNTYTAIDCNVDARPHLEVLRRAGVTTIFRYLNPLGRSSKSCSPEEAVAIAQAGLALGLVSEGWGDFAHGGISAAAGERDAGHALQAAPLLGAPDGACVYFAVDCDASEREVSKLVLPYFAELKRAFGSKYRVGVYGSGLVCSRVLEARTADLAWLSCSLGWTGSKEFLASKRWAVAQKVPKHLASFEFDPDDLSGDVGSFVPGEVRGEGAAALAAAPAVASPLERLLAEVSEALKAREPSNA